MLWEESTGSIESTKDDTVVVMQIGNPVYTINGSEKQLDVPPQLIGDRTLIPIRAVAESFDCIVDWNDADNTVVITSPTAVKVENNIITETVYKESTPVADISWNYPSFEADELASLSTINEKVYNTVTEDIANFKSAYIESGMADSNGINYLVEYGITNMQNNLLSVLFTSSITYDGQVSVSRFCKVYKLDTGDEAQLTDLFPNMTYDEIMSMIIVNFTEVIFNEPDLFYDNAAEIIAENIENAVIYPCGDEIAVSFNPGVIAPYELGFKTLTYSAEY